MCFIHRISFISFINEVLLMKIKLIYHRLEATYVVEKMDGEVAFRASSLALIMLVTIPFRNSLVIALQVRKMMIKKLNIKRRYYKFLVHSCYHLIIIVSVLGLTLALTVIPMGMGYAALAGLPLQVCIILVQNRSYFEG